MTLDISIIIATCNRHEHLVRLLESLRGLGLLEREGYEILIVENDKNQDVIKKTQEICASYNVRFVAASGYGRPHALNTGIKNAQGSYIAFTDDDCIIHDSEWAEKLKSVFVDKPHVGYVAGKVVSIKTEDKYQNMWENKGGLSKGENVKYWSVAHLQRTRHKILPWPFHKICAGANFMLSKKVWDCLEGFDIILGEQGPIKHGYTLDIGYQIARNGYELYYQPGAVLYHVHPSSSADIKRKLYSYGKGDTAYSMNIFLKYGDFRYLWWAIIGHPVYTISKMIKYIFGKYPMSPAYLVYGLWGNIVGAYSLLLLKIYKRDGLSCAPPVKPHERS